MSNLIGQSIGRYHILEQLGEGGMAMVYKAYDTRLERNVAFKVLRTEQFSPILLEQVLQRFEREAKSLAKLKHPNIVNILDFGEHNSKPFIVMEYLPGGTLKQKLGKKIPWQEAIYMLLPIARGLAYAHQHNIIHRDVKPANILIDENNSPILTDFGIAKLLETAEGNTLTGSGVGIGTPEYMAPEQGIGAHTIDSRADIYSLGIVLYEMITGRKPYLADTPMAVVLKQMTDLLPNPREFVPDLPEGVEHILFKALAKQPEDRYEDMNALIGALEGLLAKLLKADFRSALEAKTDDHTSRESVSTGNLRRQRWYSRPILWGIVGVMAVTSLLLWVIPKISKQTNMLPAATITTSPTTTSIPTKTANPDSTPTLAPTPLPFAWKRINIGHEFERDTITAFVIDPNDQGVLYTGMKNAGIFKSIDGGISWQPVHQGLANTSITSLLIDLQNSRILYAGTLGGIYKTEDGGETWSTIGSQNFLLMDPQNSAHLYARDENGIYESTDQGESWNSVYALEGNCPDKIHLWAIHPVDGRILFADGGEECEPGLYQSKDGGYGWTLVEKGESCPDRIALTIGLDKQGNYFYQEICPENGWNAFIPSPITDSTYIFSGSRLYKRKINEEKDLILGNPDVGVPTSITESNVDPNTIYVTGKGLSVSKDGGLTWTKMNNGLGSTILQMQTGLDDAGTLYLLSGNCQENEIAGDKGWIPVQPLYVSTNNGMTWDFSDQVGCYLIQDSAGSTLYRVGSPGRGWETGLIWRSTNNGKSWETVPTPHKVITLTTSLSQSGFLYLHTPETGFSSTRFFFSEDYGNKWKSKGQSEIVKLCHGSTLQFVDAHRPMAIDPFDGNHVFVIDNKVLVESHNSCDTTETFATPPTAQVNSIAFDPGDHEKLYAGTDEGAYISLDSGTTWHQINDGLLGATVVYSIVADKESNVYAATPYGIFKLEIR